MKIEIEIDIESIVKEALKQKQEKEEAPKVWTEAIMKNSRSKWEYSRRNGRRRTVEEMALHDLERKKGRKLTPEEKGEAKAVIQIDTTTENTVKEAAIKKDRIDKIAAEGMAAASKELAEEGIEIHYEAETKEVEELKSQYPDSDNITRVQKDRIPGTIEATIPETTVEISNVELDNKEEDEEATIPEAKPLDNINSLFS